MSSIDQRIVQMRFDNAQFERGVQNTLKTLDDLKKGLNLDDQKAQFQALSDVAKNLNVEHIADNVEKVSSRFGALGAIGFSALNRLTTAAIDAGTSMASAMIDPIVEGGKKRALNIEQAKFQFKGLGMNVKQSMEDALFAVKGTAFGLDEAAVVAAQFGASGVKSGAEMQSALLGISGVAAMAGASYTDVGNIFTKVAGQGRLMGDDLNRLGVRGINAAAEMAKSMGTTEVAVRKMVSEGKIGFNEFAKVMSDAFGEHATKANETYTGSLSNMRAALARVGADVATPYFESQRKIFNALTPVIDTLKGAVEPFYKVWRRLMKIRSNALVDFLTNLDLGPLVNVLNAVGKGLNRFIKGIVQGKGPLEGLHRFVSGLAVPFRLLGKLFSTVVGTIKRALFPLNLSLGISGEAIADFLGGIGDWFTNLEKKIALSGTFYKFGKKLLSILQPIIAFFQSAGETVSRVWSEFFPQGLGPLFSEVGAWFQSLGDNVESFLIGPLDFLKRAGESIKDFIQNGITSLKDAFSSIGEASNESVGKGMEFLAPIGEKIVEVWNKVTDAFGRAGRAPGEFVNELRGIGEDVRAIMADFMARLDPNVAMGSLNLGVAAVIAKIFKDILGPFNSILKNVNVLEPINHVMKGLTGTLKGMELQLKADAILKIAFAIGVLAGSMFILSKINPDNLGQASVALAALIGSVLASMYMLEEMTTSAKSTEFVKISASLMILAAAIGMMALSVKVLSTIDPASLTAGTVAMAAIMASVLGFALALSKMDGLKAGNLLAAAASVMLLGVGLSSVAGAVKILSLLDPTTFEVGFSRMLAILTTIGIALSLIPKTALLSAAALTVVAFALTLLTGPLAILGTFSEDMISKSLIMLAGSLAIIAAAMYAMTGAIPGALALLVIAGALTVLSSVFLVLGALPWDFVVNGLMVMGVIFAALAVSALLMAPAIPLILALGVAIAALGIGAMAAGAGMMMAASAIGTLAAVGLVGVGVILAFIRGLINMIPLLATNVAKGLLAFATVITQGAPVLAGALGAVLLALIDTLTAVIPHLLDLVFTTLEQVVTGLLDYIVTMVPRLVEGGLKLLTGILDGIANNIGDVVTAATNLVTEFMSALEDNIPKLVAQGFKMVIGIADGIADAIEENVPELIEAGRRLGQAIIDGLDQIIASVPILGDIYKAGKNIGQAIYDGVANLLEIHSPSKKFKQLGQFVIEGFVQGLVGGRDAVIGTYQIMRDGLRTFIDESGREIEQHISRLKSLNKDSKKNEKEIKKTEQAIKDLRKERKAAGEALEELTKKQKDNRQSLVRLGKEHDKVNEKLEAEKALLKDAIKTRDDYRESIKDQYNELPGLVEDSTAVSIESWSEATTEQIENTKKFAAALQQLRDRGLNDTMYKKLLEEGVDALPFVQDLLDAGDSGVRDINKLADELEKASENLGKSASNELYQAAVDSAKGIVDGLKKERKQIEKEMEKIAKAMAKAIKKELGIKSPSRVFRKIAIQTVEGLTGGIRSTTTKAVSATKNMGEQITDALSNTLSNVGRELDGDVDLNPRITPVLDLSKVQKDSNLIDGMFAGKTINLDTSIAQASMLSSSVKAGEGVLGQASAPSGTNINLTQYNNSPKAISPAETYRQTKNALSVAKGALPS